MEEYTTKTCSQCKQTKPLSEFHRKSDHADGHYSQCKICRNSVIRAYNDRDPQRRRTYKMLYMRQYRLDKRDRALRGGWNTDSRVVRSSVVEAVRKRVLIKPTHCTDCGAPVAAKDMCAHHEDYSKPLDVIWVCRWCHAQRHKEIRRTAAQMTQHEASA